MSMEFDQNIFIDLDEYTRGENDRVRNHDLEPGLYLALFKLLHPDYPAAKLIVEVAAISACAVGHTVSLSFLDNDMHKTLARSACVEGGYITSIENGLTVRPAALPEPVMRVKAGYLRAKQDDYDTAWQQVVGAMNVQSA